MYLVISSKYISYEFIKEQKVLLAALLVLILIIIYFAITPKSPKAIEQKPAENSQNKESTSSFDADLDGNGIKETIKTTIREFQERRLPEIFPREVEIPLNSSKIVTITGPRRSGKTYLFYSLIKKLIEKVLFFSKSYMLVLMTQDFYLLTQMALK